MNFNIFLTKTGRFLREKIGDNSQIINTFAHSYNFSAIRQYDEDWNIEQPSVYKPPDDFSAIRQYDEDCLSASLRAQSQFIAQIQISF